MDTTRDPAIHAAGLIDRVNAIVYIDVPDASAKVGHRTIYLSRGIQSLLGYGASEILDDPDQWLRVVHPDDLAAVIKRVIGHLAAPSTLSSEYRVIARDGSVLNVRDDCSSAYDPDLGVIASRGVIMDITAQRRSETQFQQFLERLPIVAYTESPVESEPFLYLGPQIATLTGFRPADFFADDRHFERLVHPEDRGSQLDGYGVPGTPYAAEYRLLHRDGRVVRVRDQAIVEVDATGAPVATHGFLIDITAEHEARAALAAAEERYRTLVEGLPLVTYIDRLDEDRRGDFPNAYMSPQIERVLGVKPEAFAADPLLWRRLVHPDDRDRAFIRYEPGGDLEDVLEYRMIRADGATIWVRDGARVLHDADGPTVVQGYILDITQAKRAEEALIRAQKLEGLGDLAGGIAHDFNNLLVSILGNAELALMGVVSDEEAHDSIVQVAVAARRAADLARQMLAYSGRGQFVVAPIAVNELVSEIADLLRVAIGKGVGLTMRLSDDIPPVEADATQLRQVVMNIVVNASDAIGAAEGRIRIATERARLGQAELAGLYGTADLAPGEYVVIEVSDTGPGMDPATLGRIFDPFFTTKFAGRGLGLAAVLGIVSGHGGGISVESSRSGGSRFRIHLPPTALPVAADPVPPPGTPGRHGTILVADDEPAVRSVARRMLERSGWTVEEVGGGRTPWIEWPPAPVGTMPCCST